MSELKPRRRVLIVGINGQDGSYLAEQFIADSWDVIGVGRQSCISGYLKELEIQYIECDLSNVSQFEAEIYEVEADLIVYTAAMHGPAGTEYEKYWREAHETNTIALHACLEYARKRDQTVQIIYFSSAKVFEIESGDVVTENSNRQSTCIYSITKSCAENMLRYYRNVFDVPGSVVWLFNHESPRRSADYFIPRVVSILEESIKDNTYTCSLNTLDFWCDWGDAEEFMKLLASSVDAIRGEDFILATGNTIKARDLVTELFEQHGLNYKDHIKEAFPGDSSIGEPWRASISKFESLTKQRPLITPLEICTSMMAVVNCKESTAPNENS